MPELHEITFIASAHEQRSNTAILIYKIGCIVSKKIMEIV